MRHMSKHLFSVAEFGQAFQESRPPGSQARSRGQGEGQGELLHTSVKSHNFLNLIAQVSIKRRIVILKKNGFGGRPHRPL